MSLARIPVLLFGQTAQVGAMVAKQLQPEFEVIHFIYGSGWEAATAAELEPVLQGKEPKVSKPNDIGTHNYARPPRAIVFGRGYTPEQAQEVHDRYGHIAREAVAWVVGDPSKRPTLPLPDDYAERRAQEVKDVINGWLQEGATASKVLLY